MSVNASLEVRIRTIIDIFLPAHFLSLVIGEVVTSPEEGKIRLQDYAFTQGFCLVMETYDKKRQRSIMRCSRHKKKTRNTRKTKEKDRKKSIINVAFNDCRYRVKMTY